MFAGAAAVLPEALASRLRGGRDAPNRSGLDDDDDKKRRTGLGRLPTLGAALLAVWLALCAYALATLLPTLTPSQKQLIFLYYQPLVPLFFTLGLWGVNLAVWARMRLQPSPLALFGTDDARVHLSHGDAFRISAAGFVAVLSSSAVLVAAAAAGRPGVAAAQPVLLYLGLAALLLLPVDALYLRPRRFFLSTLWRMLAPLQSVSFADFLLADFLTSLAKSVSDVERAVCSMATGPVLAAAADAMAEARCGSASWHIPMALALPYLIRLSQCIRQYLDNPDERTPLANAVKYASAIPVIALSALKYHVPLSQWTAFYRPFWLLASFLNSSLSFFWDLTMDWELDALRGCSGGRRGAAGRKGWGGAGGGVGHPLLRRDLLYGRPGFYYFALASNLCLRISWAYKLSSHLRHNQRTVFVVTLMEALRRFQWTFFRLEVAYLKRFGGEADSEDASGRRLPSAGTASGGQREPVVVAAVAADGQMRRSLVASATNPAVSPPPSSVPMTQ